MSSVQPPAFDPPRLVPIVHADDCGLSEGATDAIMACHDRGWLRRTSVVANGTAWAHAVGALRRRESFGVVLHLNLFEGAPLSAPADVDQLVDHRGRFCRGFAALWARAEGPASRRVRAQIRHELRQQIERFLEAFADRGPVSVDGHVHYHLLPPVLDELLALSHEYPIAAIRLPREPFYWPFISGAPTPAPANVAKNVVLRALCRSARPALQARSIGTTDAFIGVLGTGAMTLGHVRAGLESLRRAGRSGTVEIVFHPGRARLDEASIWSDRPDLRALYRSENREREAELLCSPVLGELLNRYSAPPEAGAALTGPGGATP
jgi:chitin disaccharide deacetylase